MRSFQISSLVLCALLPAVACGKDTGEREGDGSRESKREAAAAANAEGSPAIDLDGAFGGSDSGAGDGDSGTQGDGDGDDDDVCGSESIPFDFSPPNVMIVLDRSCSMRRLLDGSQFGTGPEDAGSRWNVAREAIFSMTGQYPGRVRWGLTAFPDPGEGCGKETVAEVEPAPGTESDIETALRSDDIQPFGLCGLDNSDTSKQARETPILEPLQAALASEQLNDSERDNYVILIADGGASCSQKDNGAQVLVDATKDLLDAGIKTAVIGFGFSGSEATLEAIAENGGLPNPDENSAVYSATNAEELDTALQSIIIPAVPCSFALEKTPPDPEKLFVRANDELLSFGDADGFSYDEATNTLSLEGQACSDLRFGVTSRIGVSFGCAPSECVPQEEVCNGLDDDCDDLIDETCVR